MTLFSESQAFVIYGIHLNTWKYNVCSIYLAAYTGPDSLVDKASASGAGGLR